MTGLFQSTIPSQVSTIDSAVKHHTKIISIHDTLAGIDSYAFRTKMSPLYFNPRYPRRYRLAGFRYVVRGRNISIHDTLAGIDTDGVIFALDEIHFNPRYPRRYRLQNCTKTFHSISSLCTIYTFFSHITIPSAPYITILSYFLCNISGANLPLIGCALHIRTIQILTHFKPAFNYYP